MVPHALPLQPAPVRFQVTAVFEVPVTVAANCCVLPTDTVALFGLTCTAAPAGALVAGFTVNIAVWELPKFTPVDPQPYRSTVTVQPFIAKVVFGIV
jgi:hypothetical protein